MYEFYLFTYFRKGDSLEMKFIAENENVEKRNSVKSNLTHLENDQIAFGLQRMDLQVKSSKIISF